MMKLILAGLVVLTGSIALTHADPYEDAEKVAKYVLRRDNPLTALKTIGSILNTYDITQRRPAMIKILSKFVTSFEFVVLQMKMSKDDHVCMKHFKDRSDDMHEDIEDAEPQEQLTMLLAAGIFQELALQCNAMTETQLRTFTVKRSLTITRFLLETAKSYECLEKEESMFIEPFIDYLEKVIQPLVNPEAMDKPVKALDPRQKETSTMLGEL